MPNNFEEKDNFRLENPQLQKQEYSKSQKIMATLLAFFAVIIVVLWFMQFRSSLRQPTSATNNNSNTSNDNSAQTVTDLKNKDTDKDGLSDYDELNTYKTSPYLEDSDSDGFSDKEEIDSNKDPNCPAGQDCTGSASATADASFNDNNNIASSTLNMLNQGDSASTGQDSTDQLSQEETDVLKSMVGTNMDAATLRQLLIEKGMDKTMLDKISDEDLMKSFNEALNGN